MMGAVFVTLRAPLFWVAISLLFPPVPISRDVSHIPTKEPSDGSPKLILRASGSSVSLHGSKSALGFPERRLDSFWDPAGAGLVAPRLERSSLGPASLNQWGFTPELGPRCFRAAFLRLFQSCFLNRFVLLLHLLPSRFKCPNVGRLKRGRSSSAGSQFAAKSRAFLGLAPIPPPPGTGYLA